MSSTSARPGSTATSRVGYTHEPPHDARHPPAAPVNVVTLPSSLEERTFDAVVEGIARADSGRILLDASRVRWVDPYGAIGLLAAGEIIGRGGTRAVLRLPESEEVGSYLGRMSFYEFATDIFEIHGSTRRGKEGGSDVLLEITRVESHSDVHRVVDRVHDRSGTILSSQLHYPPALALRFSAILSEVCQNIMEHAEAHGWVATQTYHWAKRLGRKVVVIGVMDLGIGFRGSLAGEYAARYGDRWRDASALEAAFIHGLTRFQDPGRGQGLQEIRKLVGRVGGKMSIRSGTARIADVPDWEAGEPLEEGLAPFPGAQINIVLPARVPEPT